MSKGGDRLRSSYIDIDFVYKLYAEKYIDEKSCNDQCLHELRLAPINDLSDLIDYLSRIKNQKFKPSLKFLFRIRELSYLLQSYRIGIKYSIKLKDALDFINRNEISIDGDISEGCNVNVKMACDSCGETFEIELNIVDDAELIKKQPYNLICSECKEE